MINHIWIVFCIIISVEKNREIRKVEEMRGLINLEISNINCLKKF